MEIFSTANYYIALVKAFPVLVFYMGAKNLPQIATRLIDAGLDAGTSIAIIHAAGTKDETCDTGTVSQVKSQQLRAKSPAIVVVGDVVDSRIDWRSKG